MHIAKTLKRVLTQIMHLCFLNNIIDFAFDST